MKKIVLLILALFCLKGVPALADEGMWVPALIQSRIKDMKAKGFKLTAEDIYSINRSSLKDAVLLFGSGCTAFSSRTTTADTTSSVRTAAWSTTT